MCAWSTEHTMTALSTAALTAGAAAIVAYGTFSSRSSLFGSVISRARSGAGNALALTFDDGPCPGSTDAILDILERERIRATFFIIGCYAARHPTIVGRIHAQGHLLGNHTFDHCRTGMFRGLGYWTEQIRRTNEIVHEITGQTPAFFRPPMGFKSPPVMRAARRNGARVVTWSRRAFDGVTTTAGEIVRRLAPASAGEILLLHDGRDPGSRRVLDATPAALPEVISRMRSRELEMVRLDELLGASASQPLSAA